MNSAFKNFVKFGGKINIENTGVSLKKKFIGRPKDWQKLKSSVYNGEEDSILCGRFPHLIYCGCKYPCRIILNKIKSIEV